MDRTSICSSMPTFTGTVEIKEYPSTSGVIVDGIVSHIILKAKPTLPKKKPLIKLEPEKPKKTYPRCWVCGGEHKGRRTHYLDEQNHHLCDNCNNNTYCCNCGKQMKRTERILANYNMVCSIQCFKEHIKKYTNSCGVPQCVFESSGIEPTFFLAEEAANFYLLYNYWLDHPEFRDELVAYTQRVADQFSQYMLYAIGGEIRHTNWGEQRQYSNYMECIDEAMGQINQGMEIKSWIVENCHHSFQRNDVWENWHIIFKSYSKVDVIKVCRDIFNVGKWGRSTGGKKWGVIANTLLMYETGEINEITFVDTAFGLKHNGNLHFDKMWNVVLVEKLLSANQVGNFKLLKLFTTAEIKRKIGINE